MLTYVVDVSSLATVTTVVQCVLDAAAELDVLVATQHQIYTFVEQMAEYTLINIALDNHIK